MQTHRAQKDIRETKKVELDKLQAETEMLLALLKSRKMRLNSWHFFLRERVNETQATLVAIQTALEE